MSKDDGHGKQWLTRHRGQWSITWLEVPGDPRTRKREATGKTDRQEAQRILDRIAKAEAEQLTDKHTVGELWEMYRGALGARPSATTMIYEWRSLMGPFGHLMPSQITEEICLNYSNARAAAGRSNGTIWTELGRLRMVFAWSVKRNHLTKAPYIPRPTPPRPRELFLRPCEIEKLLGLISTPHLKLFIVLAWTTGARASALLGLTWSSIDFDAGMINLRDPSQSRPMKGRALVPMNSTARSALLEARHGALTDYVIEYHGQRVGSVKKALKRAAVKVGKPWISPHVFRHSAAVAMAEAGIPMTEIASYLGHSNTSVTERVYARYSPQYLRKAAGALELGGTESKLRVVG